MRSSTMSFPLSDMFVRFVIITIVAVVWCSLSIPVEGVDSNAEENHASAQNCLKAIEEVQDHPNNAEMVKRFIDLCREFIDEMDLSENQTTILEQAGYKRSKKSNGTIEENDEEGKVTDKKVTDKTEGSYKKVTSDKKYHPKDPHTHHKNDGNDSITHEENDATREKDIQQPKLHGKKGKHLKSTPKDVSKPDGKSEAEEIPKDASKPDGKSETEEIKTQSPEENISQPETVAQTEQSESKSQDTQIPQTEQKQSQNLNEDPSLFDFSTIGTPQTTPEELAKTIEELKEIERILQMQKASQSQFQMHASFPHPASHGIHQPQFDQQFGQGIPQFQEWNAQFQDPAFTAGVPHMHMKFEQGSGIPIPTAQQNIPPFPQQAQFAEHFQHQHFGQGIPQMPPVPDWAAAFPDQILGQDIPQPNKEAVLNNRNEASQAPDQQQTQPPHVAPPGEDLSAKRKIDEL